jgi:hypothetical protein
MRAHIVGGGFGGLAAAALLIRNAGLSGKDITIYEADERIGGGFFLRGSAKSGYNLPGSVFDKEYRCTFELLKSIPSASNPSISVTEEFFAFNTDEPYHDKAHIFDRDGHVAHSPRFGLTLGDGFSLARVLLMPEAILDERRIEEFSAIFLDRILAPLVDDHGVAARAQRDRVSALHEPLPILVRAPVRHDGRDAHAHQSTPSIHRAASRLAASPRRELSYRRLRAGHRFRTVARPHDRRPARLYTGRQPDLSRGRTGGSSARDHRIASGRPFGGIDDRGAATAAERTVLGTVEVYQGQYDPKVLFNALKVFVCR